jgi:hypothetical protein
MAVFGRRMAWLWAVAVSVGVGGSGGITSAETSGGPKAVLVATVGVPPEFVAFEAGVGRDLAATLGCTPKHWRQIAPAVHHLALQHAEPLAALGDAERMAALAGFAELIDAKRKACGGLPVLASGRMVIGLLDPAQGLGPREVIAIANAYDCDVSVHKQESADQTLEDVAQQFLESVTGALAAGDPTTLAVLGHGLPTEIQSYHIRFERLAKALLDGVAGAGQGGETAPVAAAENGDTQAGPAARQAVDFGHVVVICDDCFSADFHINLLDELEREAGTRGLRLGSLPVCVAGTNRNCYGHADIGETFVPHFWKDVIELFYIRKPLPAAVTLRDFFEKVDNMMYGYGRVPIVDGGRVTGYTLVDPTLVQDPVVFVPLDEADLVRLRALLRLPADTPLPRWLDIG